jgi:hypothetical protein
MDSYNNDASAKELLSKLALSASFVPSYTLKDGVIKWENRIWVGNDPSVQN